MGIVVLAGPNGRIPSIGDRSNHRASALGEAIMTHGVSELIAEEHEP